MQEQKILAANADYAELDYYLVENAFKRILLVCGRSIRLFRINDYLDSLPERLGIQVIRFSDFQPNPLYKSVVEGVKTFRENKCDAIMAVGGGSAMDVAKCIKLFFNMSYCRNYLQQEIIPNEVPLIAVPTTAGTGSEATRYAVIYLNGEKQSVADNSCIPSAVVFDTSVLDTLPIYQRKATMMDAFCHAIESFWSVNSTDESKNYAKQAIKLIMANQQAYLNNNAVGNANMLRAANLAGKAINITQTTAGHAMCYKLTGIFGIAHGHAAALCVSELWPFMMENTDKCIDPRGQDYLAGTFMEIADAMSCRTAVEAPERFHDILQTLELKSPEMTDPAIFEKLKVSVNPVRLKNNPVRLEPDAIDYIYKDIFRRN